MFDNFFFNPFTVRFFRFNASVFTRISDVFVMHEVVKGHVFEFIGRGQTKNWMVLCELHQDWF